MGRDTYKCKSNKIGYILHRIKMPTSENPPQLATITKPLSNNLLYPKYKIKQRYKLSLNCFGKQ